MTHVPIPHVTEELQRHIDRELPPVLHHYTDQNGLLGIVTSAEIWATSINNLNDSREFEHARGIALDMIFSRLERESDDDKKRHLEYLHTAAIYAGINICVCSWSARADDLSQWRAYGGTGTGYSVDMKGATLKALADAQDFILAACIYEPSEQRRIIGSLIDFNLAHNIKEEKANPPKEGHERYMLEQNGGSFGYHMNRYAALFKHPGFEAEREWRLISKPLTVFQMDFRPGVSTIASHFRFSLRDAEVEPHKDVPKVRLESVHIGPCPDPDLAQRKVAFLLAKHCPRELKREAAVIPSELPYRTW